MAANQTSQDLGLFTSEERSALADAWAAVSQPGGATEEEARAASRAAISNAGKLFFTLLFQQHPDLLALFPFGRGAAARASGQVDPLKMEAHGVTVLTTLGTAVGLVQRADDSTLIKTVNALVRRHLTYEVRLEHYDIVLGSLAVFLEDVLTAAGKWDALQARAWTKFVTAFKGLAATIYAGQIPAAAAGPPAPGAQGDAADRHGNKGEVPAAPSA